MDLSDGLIVCGLLLLAGGLGAVDWRLALIVCGLLLLAGGLLVHVEAERNGRDRTSVGAAPTEFVGSTGDSADQR